MAVSGAARRLRAAARLGRRRSMAWRRWHGAADSFSRSHDRGHPREPSPSPALWARRRRQRRPGAQLGRARGRQSRGIRRHACHPNETWRCLRHRNAGRRRLWKSVKEASMRRATGWLIAALLLLTPAAAHADGLWTLYATLQSKTWVDLTHPFDTDIPHWKGFEPMTRKIIYDYDKDGFRAELFCHVGQWGTHVDPPVHFHKGARTADKIPVKQMLLPLVVIDVHREVAKNPDYVLSLKAVKAWEARHGAIPKGAFVAMRTDWSKRWPDQAEMQNLDAKGVVHYPGWTLAALKYLYEVRHITASGHETTDTDPGL